MTLKQKFVRSHFVDLYRLYEQAEEHRALNLVEGKEIKPITHTLKSLTHGRNISDIEVFACVKMVEKADLEKSEEGKFKEVPFTKEEVERGQNIEAYIDENGDLQTKPKANRKEWVKPLNRRQVYDKMLDRIASGNYQPLDSVVFVKGRASTPIKLDKEKSDKPIDKLAQIIFLYNEFNGNWSKIEEECKIQLSQSAKNFIKEKCKS